MSRYIITLEPVDKFFFGGEIKFSVGDNGQSRNSSYILTSNRMPQQTSILGMLRFLLLRNSRHFSGDKITDKAAACDLIGSKSFSVIKDGAEENCFGIIKNISACFLQKSEKGQVTNLIPAPYDHDFTINTDVPRTGYYNGIEITIPDIIKSDKSSKGYFYNKYFTNGTEFILSDKIFTEDRRLGINRNIITGNTEDNSLYKQICYRFSDKNSIKYKFAFYAEIEDSNLESYSGQTVSMGADNSIFILDIHKAEEGPSKSENCNNLKVTLTSPAYINAEVMKIPYFCITETIPFRFLNSDVMSTMSYNIINGGLGQSRKFELLDAGSIFLFKDQSVKKRFTDALEEKKGFRQIGYNQYKNN